MKKAQSRGPAAPVRRYQSPHIPMAAIRRFARQIADKFHPDKIILFGSYAYGTPHEDSDVDILVVMPCPREVTQAIRITLAFEHPFPLDLIVRWPRKLQRRLKEGNQFLGEIVTKGIVLYEKRNGAMAAKGRNRSQRRARFRAESKALS